MLAVPSLALSSIINADTWAPVFRADLDKACGLALGKSPEEFKEEGARPDQIGGPELLRGMGPEVTCDIETDGIDPRKCGILCVGVGDVKTGKVAVIWPWRDERAAELAGELKKKKRVVFHNGMQFDLLVFRNHGVIW